MVRQFHIHIYRSQVSSVHEPEHELGIKHVMVERSVLNVVSGPRLKRVPRSGSVVATQVVEREDLFEMGCVRFRHVVRKITLYMIERRYGPPMVKGPVVVRNNQDNRPTRLDDPPPAV